MKTKITHHAKLATQRGLPLPIHRFGPVDVRGMPEAATHVKNVAERTGSGVGDGPLGPGEEGKLTRDSDESIG